MTDRFPPLKSQAEIDHEQRSPLGRLMHRLAFGPPENPMPAPPVTAPIHRASDLLPGRPDLAHRVYPEDRL